MNTLTPETKQQLTELASEISARLPNDTGFVLITFVGVERKGPDTWGSTPCVFFANAPAQTCDGLMRAAHSVLGDVVTGAADIDGAHVQNRPRRQ